MKKLIDIICETLGEYPNSPPNRGPRPARLAEMQGDKPIWAQAYLWYVEHQIGESNAADRSVSTAESR